MASFGRSFKPSSTSYLSPKTGRRPGPPVRSFSNMSNKSEVSSAPSSPGVGNCNVDDPMHSEKPSPGHRASGGKPYAAKQAGNPIPDSPRSVRTRPIAIELPNTKRCSIVSSSPVYTPPAPLSARGDLPGGYFPFHEEQKRVYRSHPFHLDASKARQRSIQAASFASSQENLASSPPASAPTHIPPLLVGSVTMSERIPQAPLASASSNPSSTPVASYMPSGVSQPLPMGKYYPSNYESRQAHKHQSGCRPTSSPTSAVKSDTQVPTYRGDSSLGQSRSESEAKRRLQQYQRDMIAQATLALSGGNVNAATMNAISLRNMGFTSVSGKPSKPRLAPLGSPGPVTPMDLESSDDGYLGVCVPRSDDSAQVDEIARAIRAEEERRRREGAVSPAVETGPML